MDTAANESDESGMQGRETTNPKYRHPRILAVDIPGAERQLRESGFNVEIGTFGSPQDVEPSAGFEYVAIDASLPGYTEQEIVIVDLLPPRARTDTQEGMPPVGESTVWAKRRSGVVDPRPRAMRLARDDFQRILDHGGVFILFADLRRTGDYVYGERSYTGGIQIESELDWDNWGLLPVLDHVSVTADSGRQMRPCDETTANGVPLGRYLDGAAFTCTLDLSMLDEKSWVPLAENKYGELVAAGIRPDRGGWIFLLPRIKKVSELLQEYLENFLPGIAPELFPDTEGGAWTRRPEYEHRRIQELEKEIAAVQSKAVTDVGLLSTEIDEERARLAFLHELVTQTGDQLVSAVIETLRTLGFQEVVDVDDDERVEGESSQLREDVQVRDGSELVVVEVKGVGGHATEEDALTVIKYVNARMKERKTLDVHGLSIINPQRHLPPLDRDNKQPFSEDVVTTAEQQEIGLLTTWDLYRLTRSFMQLGWRHEDIEPLFYSSGRIEAVPSHYEFVGLIEDFWEEAAAVGVRIQSRKVVVGDVLAYELPTEFVEERAESLQVEGKEVQEAGAGAPLGVMTSLTKQQARKNTRVFRVDQGSGGSPQRSE